MAMEKKIKKAAETHIAEMALEYERKIAEVWFSLRINS
jgi:hypothetical protein